MVLYIVFRVKARVCGLLAQLVEHIVHIDGVTGSSPVQTTTNAKYSRMYLAVLGVYFFGGKGMILMEHIGMEGDRDNSDVRGEEPND